MMKQLLLSEIKFRLFRTQNRIKLFFVLSLVLFILVLLSLAFYSFSLSYFLPAFTLLLLYLFLLVMSIRKYRRFLRQKNEYIQRKGADRQISAFLSDKVKVKPLQRNDITITDQFGNRLTIFRMERKWLIETCFIDESYPTYYCVEFSEFSSKINWLSKGNDKKPKWFELVSKIAEPNRKGAEMNCL